MIKMRSTIIVIIAIVALVAGLEVVKFVQKDRDVTLSYGALSDPVPHKRIKKQQCKIVNREGLSQLNAHGSGIINYNDFLPHYKGDMSKVYVVNLIPDNLYYYENRCLRWYGLGYTDHAFGHVRRKKLRSRFGKYLNRLLYGVPPVEDRRKFQTEREIVEKLGANYAMPIKNENWLTDLSYMDNLISFFGKLPEDAVLYVHCQHGKGRTTTILVLYDIFKNHKKISLQDIVSRHYCLGREDIFDTTIWQTSWWTQEALDARKNLAVQFYAYMKDPNGYPHQTWSRWSENKAFDTTAIKIHR